MEIGPNSCKPLPWWSAPLRSIAWNAVCASKRSSRVRPSSLWPGRMVATQSSSQSLLIGSSEGHRIGALVERVERPSVEQVTCDEVSALGLVKSDVSGRVAGSVQD